MNIVIKGILFIGMCTSISVVSYIVGYFAGREYEQMKIEDI